MLTSMNLRESYYVSSNSDYNISYIYLHKIPYSTPRSPPTHLQKQLVSFLSCCKGHTRTKGKQKNTILRDQLKLNQKCSQQHSVSSPLFDIIPILKLLHLLHLQKLPQKKTLRHVTRTKPARLATPTSVLSLGRNTTASLCHSKRGRGKQAHGGSARKRVRMRWASWGQPPEMELAQVIVQLSKK